MVPSNENVTEERGGKAALRARKAAFPPRSSALLGSGQLLSLAAKQRFQLGQWRCPRGAPGIDRSLHATVEGWSVHTGVAAARGLAHQAPLWRGGVDRASEPGPTCVSLCLPASASPRDASPAGTGCSTPTCAHRAHWLP